MSHFVALNPISTLDDQVHEPQKKARLQKGLDNWQMHSKNTLSYISTSKKSMTQWKHCQHSPIKARHNNAFSDSKKSAPSNTHKENSNEIFSTIKITQNAGGQK